MLNIVITMAGYGTRFSQAGYKQPKYRIEVKNKTLFEWSLYSLDTLKKDAFYIFIAREDDRDIRDFIQKKCIGLNITNYKVHLLDHATDGQATTALHAATDWLPDNPLLIYNIDTYIEEGQLCQKKFTGDGCIPCFDAPGTHWSFVKTDINGKVTEVREKKRISNHCCVGAYYFKTGTLYEQLYEAYYGTSSAGLKEKYIAPMYNRLIAQGRQVNMFHIESSKVHALGMPEEVEAFLLL